MKEKEALFYKKLKNNAVQCQLCPHFCVINESTRGKCNVRINLKGKLISLVYGKPCSVALDNIEKKPLYHFLPGEKTLSIATAGCNLKCLNCQNWQISQAIPESIPFNEMMPKQVVQEAKKAKSRIISYTYTEPTIFYEYVLDTAKLAKRAKLKNIIVSNGFINQEPLKKLIPYIDAANIDLKSISNEFYVKNCSARLQPILDTLVMLKKKGIWVEIANLIIPTLNDKESDIKKLVKWIKENLGKETPIHFSAFYPCYKLSNLPPTPASVLKKAREIALHEGMQYIYTGNINDEQGSTTFCPRCKKAVIKRNGFYVIENLLKNRKCPFCNEKIAGVWN